MRTADRHPYHAFWSIKVTSFGGHKSYTLGGLIDLCGDDFYALNVAEKLLDDLFTPYCDYMPRDGATSTNPRDYVEFECVRASSLRYQIADYREHNYEGMP